MTTLRSWHAKGKWTLLAGLAATGAVAGFVAWAFAFAGHLLFGISRPGALALLLAVPRGALFGAILALILRAYWNRSGREERTSDA